MFYRKHARVCPQFSGELITKQSHKAECDINTILKQYQKTGILTHISKASANYQDLPSDLDYQHALNIVIEAEQAFSELPAKIRDRFKNDPKALLAALNNPAMRAELQELGVLNPDPTPTATPQTAAEANAAGVGSVSAP